MEAVALKKNEGTNLEGEASTPKVPYLIFSQKERLFAVAAEFIHEILLMPRYTPVPRMPDYTRGVINLRGKILQLVDLRVRLHLTSSLKEIDDLINILNQRQEEHATWVNELESCVKENRPFTLQRDPTQCTFGKWLDSFNTENRLLKRQLKKMNAPHKRIHDLANDVFSEIEKGRSDKAFELINEKRTTDLNEVNRLFEECRQTTKSTHRELAVVVQCRREWVALSADSVVAMERVSQEQFDPLPSFSGMEDIDFVERIIKFGPNQQIAFVIRVDDLLPKIEEDTEIE